MKSKKKKVLKILPLLLMLMSVLIVLTGCLSLHKESNIESLLVPEFDTTLVFPDLCWVYQNGMYCISEEDADKLLDFAENKMPQFLFELEQYKKIVNTVTNIK